MGSSLTLPTVTAMPFCVPLSSLGCGLSASSLTITGFSGAVGRPSSCGMALNSLMTLFTALISIPPLSDASLVFTNTDSVWPSITATLLHDDVVDESDLRRGNETANALFGNAASVLVGDFLYSRAFEMMIDVDDMRVMQILATTTNVIAEGEVMQLMNVHDAETTEEKYLEVIHCKTAKLFEAATRLGAVLCHRDKSEEQAMAAYGRYLGTAFQLIDDVMDYSSSSEAMGKNVGDDLAEGKPTLPLIYAIQQGTAEQAALIKAAIEKGGYDKIDEVQAIIEHTGALVYTEKMAQQQAQLAIEALSSLPDGERKTLLENIARLSVHRSH